MCVSTITFKYAHLFAVPMKEAGSKKNWVLMLFIVLIMIGTSFSVFLYNDSGQSQVVRYEGIKFTGDGTKWTAKINGRFAAFSFLPGELADIKTPPELSGVLGNRIEIDVTSDANSTFKESIALAQHQIGLVMCNYGVYVYQGFTGNNSFNFPIVTCGDATSAVPVIYFQESNSTQIEAENGCILAKASSEADFIRVKDRIVYSMLGVMK